MHVHHFQEESLSVREGTIGWVEEGGTVTEIPGPVQKFVFPVVVAVGRLFGKHKRFADAPEPRRA